MIVIGRVVDIDTNDYKYTVEIPEKDENGNPVHVVVSVTAEMSVSVGDSVMVFGRRYKDEIIEDLSMKINDNIVELAYNTNKKLWDIYGPLTTNAKERDVKETEEAIDELAGDETTEGGDEE